MSLLHSIDLSEEPTEIIRELQEELEDLGYVVRGATPIYVSKEKLTYKQISILKHDADLKAGSTPDGICFTTVVRALEGWKTSKEFKASSNFLIEATWIPTGGIYDEDMDASALDPLIEGLNRLKLHCTFNNEYLLFSTSDRIYEEGPNLGVDD